MTRPRWALSADGNRMATASPGAEVFASEIRSQKSCKIKQITVRARSSNWIEQGTPNAYNIGFRALHSVVTGARTRAFSRV